MERPAKRVKKYKNVMAEKGRYKEKSQ